MAANDDPTAARAFLKDGGETGQLIAQRDWSQTLGPIESWPQSLKTATAILLRSPVPIVMLWGADGIMIYNDAYSVFAGARHPQLLGSKVREGWAEVADFNDNVMRVCLAGGTLHYQDQELMLARHGRPEKAWMNLDYSAVLGEDGKPAGVWAIVVETTARIVAEKAKEASEAQLRASRDKLADETRALEILNAAATKVAAELDTGALVQTVVDAGVELTGAKFGAFFYTVKNNQDEALMLYALAGAERAQFQNLGMPRPTAVFSPTFKGEGVVRSDDILADPRYGKFAPHHGMPKGHLPVRSYLAVPVVSRAGHVIGGLFFGHDRPGMFDERAERVMTGLAAQAAIGIDNARLLDDVKRANASLEMRVQERTLELEKAHDVLRQSQKMEAVGHLTGGVAHDFNNMLAVVIGSLDLLTRRIGVDDPRAKRYLDAAMDGARRAAQLTQRLLAFARQQPLRPESLALNKLVSGMSDLLRHSLGAQIQLETVLAGGLWRSHADPNQLENAILNLAVNARDAMAEGGKLTIETQNAYLDEYYASENFGTAAGQYVLIAVTDTGMGMPAEVIAKAFDPFFTTKGVGKGTGLGLSQVYGFVKQSGGHVKIYSEIGHGTTIKIYLPRFSGAESEEPESQNRDDLPRGEAQEVILVVEDEPSVRQFSLDALSELGYRVLEADGAVAALRQIDAHPEIALMFTDVVMPNVNGAKLAEEVRRRRPGLKILFTTGYTRNAVVHNGVLDPGVQMIGKPYTIEQLAAKVREVLDEQK